MSSSSCNQSNCQNHVTVIGAGWCGFTKKLVAEIEEARDTAEQEGVDLQFNFHYIDCGGPDKDHQFCKHENVKGFPLAVPGHDECAQKHLDEGKIVSGYQPVGSHPLLSGQVSCAHVKDHDAASGAAPKATAAVKKQAAPKKPAAPKAVATAGGVHTGATKHAPLDTLKPAVIHPTCGGH